MIIRQAIFIICSASQRKNFVVCITMYFQSYRLCYYGELEKFYPFDLYHLQPYMMNLVV